MAKSKKSRPSLPLSQLPVVPLGTTVHQAQAVISQLAGDGSDCPCCGQRVQLYGRVITSAMAHWLVVLWLRWQEKVKKAPPTKKGDCWVQIKEIKGVRGGDYAKLKLWELVEARPKDPADPDQRNSGYWRPTKKGQDFVIRAIQVPRKLWLYNSKVVLTELNPVDIVGCFKQHFDYYDLMGMERP